MRWMGMALAAGALAGCEFDDPCERYVDYMCACHDGDDGITCEEYEATYLTGAFDLSVDNECSVLLDEQRADDEEEGLDCFF